MSLTTDKMALTQDEINRELAASIVGILHLLVSKGICTEKEFLDARVRATAAIDQLRAEWLNSPEGKKHQMYQLLASIGL